MSGFWLTWFAAFQEDLRSAASEWVASVGGQSAPALDAVIADAAFRKFQNADTLAIRQRVLTKYRRALGRRIRAVSTGGSPTPERVIELMRECFPTAQVINAYGTTEVPEIASNGTINPSVEFRLVDAPEVEYTAADKPYPPGEIGVRSPDMATKYWGREG
jgi:long-subunit acyl-CoA synthetase (AMP-forming)